MEKMMRLATAGLGLVAGLAFAAAPAQAATAAPSAEGKQSTQADRHRDRDVVVGYYRSLRACELAGRIGERFGRWHDYDCDYQRRGFHRGVFALEVERGWGGDRPGHHGGHHRGR